MSSDLPLNVSEISLKDAVIFIVDNRGKTAPTESTGIALIATNCVNNKDLYPQKLNLRYVSQYTYENWFRSHPQPGDILLTNKGSQNGAVCLVPSPVDFCIAQDMVALRADPKKINPLYLFAALRSDLVQKRIKALNVDAVIPHLKKTDFDKLYVPLPEKRVQDWIGDSYFELSSRIELLRETNTTLESIAQALFKSWFVDFDPVHANAGTQASSLPPEIQSLFPSTFVESSLGLVPEGWGVGTIGDLANVKGGFAFKGDSFCDSGVPVIKIKNIVGDGTVDIEGVQYVDIEQAEKSKKFLLDDGDILMAMTGATIGKTGIVVTDSQAPLLNQRVAKFEPKSQDLNNGWLIYTAFQNGFMADQILNAASGSAQANISTSGIESAKLMLPANPSILKAFEDIASTIFSGWIENHKQSKTLSILRDTLLPRLISGQVRLPDIEECV